MNLDHILSFMYVESTRLNDQGNNSEAIYTSEQLAVQALNTLGLTYCNNKMFEKSIRAFETAVKIDEGNWLLWSNIAHAYSVQDNRLKALEAALRSVEYCNKSAFDPYYNSGVILTSLNRIDEAKEMYKIALEIRPNDPNANYNLGLLMLRTGLCKEGWEKYEYRFETSKLTGKFRERFCGRPSGLVQPHWDGRKYKNKSLLVYSEQGLGDFIFFARFLPMVKKLGGNLIVEIQEPLKNIISPNLKIDELVVRPNNIDWPEAPESDYCLSVCSLPSVLKIYSEDKIPTEPYIFAPKKPRPKEFSKKKFNIGLCWCGNPDHPRDCQRSMFIEQFKPLTGIKNVEFYRLLKGVEGKRTWPSGFVNTFKGIENFPMHDLSPQIEDYADLAHFINHLDLVITVDTGLAHLAAAMGKTVWMILGSEFDWRWGDQDQTTIWYPTMRIFRRKDTWENLIQEIQKELIKVAP